MHRPVGEIMLNIITDTMDNLAGRKHSQVALSNEMTQFDFRLAYMELAMARFEYLNLPETIDERMIEWNLCLRGKVMFAESALGLVAGNCAYMEPDYNANPRRAEFVGENGQLMLLREQGSFVIGWDSDSRSAISNHIVGMYAARAANIQNTIDSLLIHLKRPVLLVGPDSLRNTMTNLYAGIVRGESLFVGVKGSALNDIELKGINMLPPGMGEVVKNAYQALRSTTEEFNRFIGVESIDSSKRERFISSEIAASNAEVKLQLRRYLRPRERMIDKVNEMFGTNIIVRTTVQNGLADTKQDTETDND